MIQNLKSKIVGNKRKIFTEMRLTGRCFFSKSNSSGFTLIELLVVVSIMVMLTSVIVINIAGQRDARNITIAQSNLVTNIRAIQSYALSGRNFGTTQSVQYYIMKFDLAKPTQYTVQAMYNVDTSPQLQDIQTYNFPPNIQLAPLASNPIIIDRTLINKLPLIDAPNTCALIAFSVPFGRTYFSNGCNPRSFTSPYTITNSDDYQNILNFVTNTDGSTISTDSNMCITLTSAAGSKRMKINGVNGAVSFDLSSNSNSCQ